MRRRAGMVEKIMAEMNTEVFYTNPLLFHLAHRDDPDYRRTASYAFNELDIACIVFQSTFITEIKKMYERTQR